MRLVASFVMRRPPEINNDEIGNWRSTNERNTFLTAVSNLACPNSHYILCFKARSQKLEKGLQSFVVSVCPSAWKNAAPIGRIFMKFIWLFFENLSREFEFEFKVHVSVHCKNILIYVQLDATLHSLFYLETALHVSGGTITHHQERKQLYLQHLVLVTPLLLSAAIVEELELVWVCCGWRTPAHSNQVLYFNF